MRTSGLRAATVFVVVSAMATLLSCALYASLSAKAARVERENSFGSVLDRIEGLPEEDVWSSSFDYAKEAGTNIWEARQAANGAGALLTFSLVALAVSVGFLLRTKTGRAAGSLPGGTGFVRVATFRHTSPYRHSPGLHIEDGGLVIVNAGPTSREHAAQLDAAGELEWSSEETRRWTIGS